MREDPRNTVFKDLAVIAVLSFLGVVLADYFDAFEAIVGFARRLEPWNLDELIFVPIVIGFAFGAFAWRRWQELKKEIDARKTLEEQLRYQALHDPLTGVANRILFLDRFEHALAQARRKETRVVVFFIDLDNFKVVNDSLGHKRGDRLLMAVAERLQNQLRSGDTLARFGGDEFTVLLEDVINPSCALRVADRIVESFKEPFQEEGEEMYVTASIGVCVSSSPQDQPEQLLHNAAQALYRAKQRGKGIYELFEQRMYAQIQKRLQLTRDLGQAIQKENLRVYYQPKVSLQDGRVVGVEALVRWEHPEWGLLDPDQFVPIAEETGLIIPIGTWVLKEACKQAKRWQENLSLIPPLSVQVNISGKQLQRANLLQTVEEALEESGLEARCLGLDITETVLIEATDTNSRVLEELKKLGVFLAIDDFGTGYSSLSYLKRFPVEILKIDKSFVQGLGEDIEERALVQMIVDLAHARGLDVIAEGVESAEQMRQLQEMGCDKGQGQYFSKPLSDKTIEPLLSKGVLP